MQCQASLVIFGYIWAGEDQDVRPVCDITNRPVVAKNLMRSEYIQLYMLRLPKNSHIDSSRISYNSRNGDSPVCLFLFWFIPISISVPWFKEGSRSTQWILWIQNSFACFLLSPQRRKLWRRQHSRGVESPKPHKYLQHRLISSEDLVFSQPVLCITLNQNPGSFLSPKKTLNDPFTNWNVQDVTAVGLLNDDRMKLSCKYDDSML